MSLDRKQRGVAAGMAIGLTLSIAALCAAPDLLAQSRIEVLAAVCLLLPTLSLAFSIARLAKHRFFTPQDIDGSGLSAGSDRARMLQALLQNTLEQSALALPVYGAALYVWPDEVARPAALCACLFVIGRILFFARYAQGASARALGFALTFYPTVILLAWQLVLLVRRVVG